jgi:arginyl-tRNA synthetase
MTKPLHIGHLRSHNIGNALDRIHRFLGFRVIADNHLGDWGTQFGITIMGYRHFGDPSAMVERPLEELERVYVESYEKAKADPEWMEQCRSELVKLQSGDAENFSLWEEFMQLSIKELDRVYQRLGVSYDMVRGESHYRDKLESMVALLKEKGLAVESEGALVVKLDEEKLPVCIVRKSDGGFNYATTDLATVRSRVEEFGPAKIVYITDERQQLHFKQFFAVCRRLGYETELVHVWFGLMRLPEATFSTREGNVIPLEELLDEAEKRVLAVVRASSPNMDPDEQREVARAVGIGAVKYADLSQNPQSLVTFTWEKALALDGNSGPYLQYACARIASVCDKYRERFPDGDLENHPIRFTEDIERTLGVKLTRYAEVVVRAALDYKPSILTDYLFDLAQTYSTFHQNVPFLKAPEGVRESRVRLCGIVDSVLRNGLNLLGLDTPARI